jgi:hypothetical protein
VINSIKLIGSRLQERGVVLTTADKSGHEFWKVEYFFREVQVSYRIEIH